MDIPLVAVVPFQEFDCLDMIKEICNDCTQEIHTENAKISQIIEWQIDNKYYRAPVRFNVFHVSSEQNEHICAATEAVIVCFDTNKESNFEAVVEGCDDKYHELELKLLVVDRLPSDGLLKKTVTGWCIKHCWELVELSPEESDSDGGSEALEDALTDSFGAARMRQALHAHTWSNLVMKDDRASAMNDALRKLTLSDCKNKASDDDESEDDISYERFGLDDSGFRGNEQENFERLFESFADMKEKARRLSSEQRKDYAEKMAVAFLAAFDDEEGEEN